jgi:hypothetical protein
MKRLSAKAHGFGGVKNVQSEEERLSAHPEACLNVHAAFDEHSVGRSPIELDRGRRGILSPYAYLNVRKPK